MENSEFEQLVLLALEELPEIFKEKLENIAVVVEEKINNKYPGVKIESNTMLLGLYQGVPYTKRDTGYFGALPDRITIFQKPIESICRTKKQIKEKIKEIVVHEIGHYFGLDEKDLR